MTACLLTGTIAWLKVPSKTSKVFLLNKQLLIKVFKSFLVASTTMICLIVICNSSGARTDEIQVDTRHSDRQHSDDLPHHGSTIEIPPGRVPVVDITVHQDPVSGWNLETNLTNFRFAPENASKAAKPGEGHAHIYLNGKKVARLYSSWYHLDGLKPGRNQITVGLNANSHEALVHNGQRIQATEIVQITN